MPAQYPGNGYVADSQTNLLRKLVNNTALIAASIPAGTPASFVPVPATKNSPGSAGEMAEDGSYLYVYSATAVQWLRVPISDY